MDPWIIGQLSQITAEEREILARGEIDRARYMAGAENVIAGAKLLAEGVQIAVRPHTRFVRFPAHTHDYVEIVYMCAGQTTHIINGATVVLRAGELLLLGQHARQEILPAGEGDVAVNFIVRPAFFSGTLDFLGSEDTPLRQFILRCLCGEGPSHYLHFRVADVKPVQNLVENLLWTLLTGAPNRRSINQLTMGLLFVQLLNCADRLSIGGEEEPVVRVLHYIEEHYAGGSLTQIAAALNYDAAWLSRKIKAKTGRNFVELMQEKRLSQAAWLLRNTPGRIADVAAAVGYENVSYFNRIFIARFGVTPKQYRSTNQDSSFVKSAHCNDGGTVAQ